MLHAAQPFTTAARRARRLIIEADRFYAAKYKAIYPIFSPCSLCRRGKANREAIQKTD
jgi:hypothetical protein